MRVHSSLAVIAVWLLHLAGDDIAAAGEPKPGVSDLEGKYVLLFLKDKQIYALEKVQVRSLGKETFLIGNRVSPGSPTQVESGYMVWVAATNVFAVHVFASIDDLRKTKGAKYAVERFGSTEAPASVSLSDAPSPRVEPEKQTFWRWDWTAIAGAIGVVMFLIGLLAERSWNRGRTATAG